MIFGKLEAIKIVGRKGRICLWLCECSCGEFREVTSSKLISGRVLACKKCSSIDDISGKKFNRLTAIKIIGQNKWNSYIWLCRCECGNMNTATTSELKLGKIKSCGCLHKESVGIMKDICGKRSGKLIALNPTKKKDGYWYWNCKCDCGNFIEVNGTAITRSSVKSCGCLTESIISTQLKQYCIYKYSSKSEYKILKNPETGRFLPYDIYIPKYNIFIEVNGQQHYKKTDFWNGRDGNNYEKQKIRDNIKRKYAKKNGIYIEIDLRKIKTISQAILEIEGIIEKHFKV